MNRLRSHLLASSMMLALASATGMAFAGAQTAIAVRPGSGVRRADPLRQKRNQAQAAIAAAQAKRDRRSARDARWLAAGAFRSNQFMNT